jgi:broad specificity phosphatase PhoE
MIYLIRHGEPAGAYGAHPNPGLTELGVRQAFAAAEALAKAGRQTGDHLAAGAQPGDGGAVRKADGDARPDRAGVGEIITPPGHRGSRGWLKGVMAGGWSATDERLQAWRKSVLAAVESLPDETAVFSHFIAINAIVGLLTDDDRVVVVQAGPCVDHEARRALATGCASTQLGAEAATVVT